MAILLLSAAFIVGALTVVAAEVIALWILIRRLSRKGERKNSEGKGAPDTPLPGDLNSSLSKQGFLWILDPDKVQEIVHQGKVPAERRRRQEILDVTPVQKYAIIKGHYLMLLESDDSSLEILLTGCSVLAISSSSLSSRKWAKRYPIKVESKDSVIYKGSKIIYLYLETSWEKESWSRALRLASTDDSEKIMWFSKLNTDFQYYLALLNAGYPSFMKSTTDSNSELNNNSAKLDDASSKVRQFLRKIAKKASKSGHENKAGVLVSGHDEKKIAAKSVSFRDSMLGNGLGKRKITGKSPDISFDNTSMALPAFSGTESEAKKHVSGVSDADSKHKYFDEGPLCFNVLVSRLFFDAKNNHQIRSSLHNRIQRALSNMRVPSYIGEVVCTAVDPGTLPPCILGMRVLPSDMNEVWALEVNFEYVGGMVLEIETRLEVQELEFEGEDARLDSKTAGEVTSGLLEGFEYLGKQLNLSDENIGETKSDEGYLNKDETEMSKIAGSAPSRGSRWKSIVHSIAKQVSQVPLSLGIRVSSLTGTIRLYMKPPPSDRIWFGFTSMPDIQFNVDSSVGDHKITNGRLDLFLINRFKAAICDTLVLPNSESVVIPWMLAEKDDWAPREVAPFVWYKSNQHSATDIPKREGPCFQPEKVIPAAEVNQGKSSTTELNQEKSSNHGCTSKICESLDEAPPPSSSIDELVSEHGSLEELRNPLLNKDKMPELSSRGVEDKLDIQIHLSSRVGVDGPIRDAEDDDTKQRKTGTRERMRGLGKKMGEKLEVKRRHIEEKGRSFVEKMRAP